MNKIKAVLFDLDGTIIDSAEGIFNCLEYSLEYFGIKHPREAFYKCLGPALRTSFMEFVKPEQVEKAIEIYRERYKKTGLYECKVYDGAEQMLKKLYESGLTVALATSKPEPYAVTILKHFNLDKYFHYMGGAAFDGSRDTKASVIKYVMSALKLEKDSTVMIGDRMHDMQGAAECEINSIGVLYGYGSREELTNGYSPLDLAGSAQDLCAYLIKQTKGAEK